MQYLLLIYANEAAWDSMTPAQQEEGVGAYFAYAEALSEADALVSSSRLTPSTSATTVRLENGKSQVLDGPYADSKEQLGGFYLIDAPDLDSAISWAARCPGAAHGIVEVRPLWDMTA
jgi:hypothetical protein